MLRRAFFHAEQTLIGLSLQFKSAGSFQIHCNFVMIPIQDAW